MTKKIFFHLHKLLCLLVLFAGCDKEKEPSDFDKELFCAKWLLITTDSQEPEAEKNSEKIYYEFRTDGSGYIQNINPAGVTINRIQIQWAYNNDQISIRNVDDAAEKVGYYKIKKLISSRLELDNGKGRILRFKRE